MTVFKIFTDGGARGNPGPAASAFVVFSTDPEPIYVSGKYLGHTTNNFAEYTAVLLALNWLISQANQLDPTTINFYLDSELVVNQLTGKYRIKDPHLKSLYDQIQTLLSQLQSHHVTFTHIPRSQNSRADLIVNQTLDLQHSPLS